MPPKKNQNTSKTNKSKHLESNSGKDEKKGGNAVKVCKNIYYIYTIIYIIFFFIFFFII